MSQSSVPGFNHGYQGAMSQALQEYRGSGKRPTMESLIGHVVEFAKDSHGSRFIQFKMETATDIEKKILLAEVLPETVALAAHQFGNYVIQNFLQHCNESQRADMANQFATHLRRLSNHAHGCRVVQFALDIVSMPQRNQLIDEIVGSIREISKNNHGTHVVQKCMGVLTTETLSTPVEEQERQNQRCMDAGAPTTSELLRKVETIVQQDFLKLAIDPHSYRLVQLTIADCNPKRSKTMHGIMERVAENFQPLALDQHGNFILQHILDFGSTEQTGKVQGFVCNKLLLLSQHKFGSHLVEKCLSTATVPQVRGFVEQILIPSGSNRQYLLQKVQSTKELDATAGKADVLTEEDHQSALLLLSKDPYGNFVVQRILDTAAPAERKRLTDVIRKRSEVLSRFAYGRHILSHLSKLDPN